MSILCDALLVFGLSTGAFCQQTATGVTEGLPPDDGRVWQHRKPEPEPVQEPEEAAVIPPFPAIFLNESSPAEVIEKIIVKVVPASTPAPDPFRVALERALSSGDGASATFKVEGSFGGAASDGTSSPLFPTQIATLDPSPSNTPESYESEGRTSGLPVDNSRILTSDRYITGVMETGLNSQVGSTQGGAVIIQTSRDVFGYHGRNVLIPKGSRLICDYESPGKQGETRIAFTCTRILMAGYRSEIHQLAAPVGDVQGRGGVTGEVDNRFWERYGTAFTLAGISAAVRYASVLSVPTNPDGSQSVAGAVADSGSQEISQKFGEITASILEETVSLVPIVTIAQGTRIQIRPQRDWYIQKPEG